MFLPTKQKTGVLYLLFGVSDKHSKKLYNIALQLECYSLFIFYSERNNVTTVSDALTSNLWLLALIGKHNTDIILIDIARLYH